MKVIINKILKEKYNNITVSSNITNDILNKIENEGKIKTNKLINLKMVASFSMLILIIGSLYITNLILNNKNTIYNNIIANNITENNNNSKDNIAVEEYANVKPYKVIAFSSSKSYDVTDVKKLYKNVDLIVTGKVIEKKAAEISEIIPTIHTPGTLTVFNVIKGSIISNNINFIVLGGKISLEDYENTMKNIYPDTLDKEEISKLDTDFKQQNYILCKDEYSNDFYNKQEYVMFLNKIGDTDEYAVVSYAGMIPIANSSEIKSIEQVFALEKVKKD